MTLEDIQEKWSKCININIGDLGGETANIPIIHNKFYNIYINEGLKLKKIKFEYSSLKKLKMQYFNGSIDDDELKEKNWKPFQLKVLKSDIDMYIQADEDIQNILIRIALQETKVNLLESIIKQIRDRGFHIKTILEWEKFRVGAI